MNNPLIPLRQALENLTSQAPHSCRPPKRRFSGGRKLSYEPLESRQLLAVVSLANMSVSENTGEKPESKTWEYAGQWWSVMPKSDGTWVWRLDGTSWTPTYRITTDNAFHADVKVAGNVAHALLYDASNTQLASLEYVGGSIGYQMWSQRPTLVSLGLPSSAEAATVDIDSIGRMWVASDVTSTIEVRYSDGNYSTWSDPITIASGINSDDISVITAMPGGKIGVLWSDQSTDRFGFRVHVDGTAANVWLDDEVPASQSALKVGGGMADDHLNVAVTSDGTLYAAVKTSYDKSGYPKMALLVRRPNGTWDDLYQVDTSGTRPIVLVNEAAGRLIVAYTTSESGGNIVFKESPLGTIQFGGRQTLIAGTVNNVTSTKQNFTGQVAVLAGGSSSSTKGALFSFNTISLNKAPVVNAGPDRTVTLGTSAMLDGTVTDDGLPAPPALTYTWSKISGPGNVTFGNATAVDTTATFGLAGTYVLRLTASDGQLSGFDEMTVTANAPVPDSDPSPDPIGGTPTSIAFQDGLFPSVTYAGTHDTYINSGSSKTNYGSSSTLTVDGSPDKAALFKWDVSAIPAGSTVTSAVIELNISNAATDTYQVYALNRAWDELSATWQQFAAGQNWSTAGASGSADRGSASLGSISASNTGTYRITLNAAGIAAVEAWVNNPAANFGVIIQDYSVSNRFDARSSETSNASQRPKLLIDYTPPGSTTPPNPGPVNTAPSVNAGADLAITFGNPASLHGSANDDGLLSALATTWSKTSGPGNVTFGNASALDTTASFSQAGTYVLRLTASDGEFVRFDELTVTVSSPIPDPEPPGGTPTSISFQDGLFPSVTYAGTHDTYINSGSSKTNYGSSSTLTVDGSPDKAALFKWDVSAIPAGSTVTSAVIELNISNAATDTYQVYALNRAWDELSATWQQFAAGQNWSTAGASGSADRGSASLGSISASNTGTYRITLNAAGIAAVEAWVNNPAANFGVIIQDYSVSNRFDARSSETSNASQRPKLLIDYTPPGSTSTPLPATSPENTAPAVSAGPDLAVTLGNPAALHGSASDDGLLIALATTWTKTSGPGTVTFADVTATETTATFSQAGAYGLRLTASDGELVRFDELIVTVSEPVQAPIPDPTSDPEPPSSGDTPSEIAFQNGLFPSVTYAGTQDTYISSKSTKTNYGDASTLTVDGSPDKAALFQWDVSAIPTGSIIVSAAIELNVSNSSSERYNVYALNQAWDELSATWRQYAANHSWSTAGASGAADHAAASLGTIAASSTGVYRIDLNDAGVAAVQAWVNDAVANHGVIIQDYSQSNRFDVLSSQTARAVDRPKLIIDYTSPAAAGAAFAAFGAGNEASLVSAGPDLVVKFGTPVALHGWATDDGLLNALTTTWSKVSGPGSVTIASPTSLDTTAQFSTTGTYVLRLTAFDGLNSAFDELSVTVSSAIL